MLINIIYAVLAASTAVPAFGAPAPAPSTANPLSLIKRAEGHEVAQLFEKRQSNYPPSNAIPPDSSIPKAWLDKLATLNLPSDVPISTGTPLPAYGSRSKSDPTICSFTYECINPEDLYAPPAAHLALTFDDGPSGGTDSFLNYLRSIGKVGVATHFMIGSYIANDQNKFKAIAGEGGHIGVHTWSHNYMTTLTNNQIVAELGWTMQIISDLHGGRVAQYWRPPFGDVDNRVRAIAKGVFGLETVIWNHDTGDWNLDQGNSYTIQSVTDTYIGWFNDKSKGISVLEHEVRPSQIEVLKNVYPRAVQMGWTVGNVAESWGKNWYQNARDGNSTVTPMSVGAAGGDLGSMTASRSASASASASSGSNSTMSSSSSSSANVTSTSTSSSASITSTSSSASSSVSGVVAAASPSQSRVSAAGTGIQLAMAAIVVPVLGMMAVLI